METKRSFQRVGFVLPVVLVALLLSSPAGAQTNYSVDPVTPSYIQANTVLPLTGDDSVLQIALPFPFTFYGATYNQAYVSTNGYINFLAENSFFSNTCLSTAATPNGAIYAFWDDLYVDGPASVRTQLLGTTPNQQFVIEWRNVTFFGDWIRRVSFEIVLHQTGAIVLQYSDISGIADDGRERGWSATVGVENHTGDVAAQFSCNTESIAPGEFAVRFSQATRAVPADIKPMACPNPLNVGSKGVLPFAILGTADFDVTTIDPKTVTLTGVAPLRWGLEDVGTPYVPFVGKTAANQCNALGPDGYQDMTFKFDTEAVAAALGNVNDREVRTLQLRGQLKDGTEFRGEDVVTIIKKGK